MSDRENEDQTLDRRLCDVFVPESLALRLRAIPALGDEDLDWQLRDVPTSKGLEHRLRQIVLDEHL
ncbi:MAG: hypothetical protein JJ992_06375, partial [Planctomycetes bacterium]|nr:hypothetical protein [Planctomycetota bacterium]